MWCSESCLGLRWLQAPRGSRPFAGTTRRGSGAWYRSRPARPSAQICNASLQGTGLTPPPRLKQVTRPRGDWEKAVGDGALSIGLGVSSEGATCCPALQRAVRCLQLAHVGRLAGAPILLNTRFPAAPLNLGFMFGPAAALRPGTAVPGVAYLRLVARIRQPSAGLFCSQRSHPRRASAAPSLHSQPLDALALQPERPRQADPQQRHRRGAGDAEGGFI